MTPSEVLRCLTEGNARFAAGNAEQAGRIPQDRERLVTGQTPMVTVLGCSDSRVPPEILLDRGLGEVFTVRTAGHTLDPTVLGSVEFGVMNLGTPLVVVLGHTGCGAVTAACAVAEGGPIPAGHVAAVTARILAPFAETPGSVEEAQRGHAEHTLNAVLVGSPGIRAAVAAGDCAVLAATYDLADGLLRPVAHQGELDLTVFPER